MSWKLGPSGSQATIPAPSDFKIESADAKIRTGRTASGRLVVDVVATKKRFTLGYKVLTTAQIEILLTEFDRREFLAFTYPDRGVDRTTTVWFAVFPRPRLLQQTEYWGEFEIVLEEQ